jgi:DNA-binding NarL/FixJ family response regulator
MDSTATEPVRLFLVAHSEGFARSVARYFGGDPRIALTGVAPSLALAGMRLSATRSELVLFDWSAFSGSPRDAVLDLRQGCPGLRIVCVAYEAAAYRSAASRAGIDAVISRDELAEELEPLLRGFFPERFSAGPA